jgi:hypothetical protein
MADTDGDGVNDKDDLDPNGFDRLAGTYEVVAGTFTWEQAKADAAAKGGYLATVGSAGEWEAMRGQLGEGFNARGLWFGGVRPATSAGTMTLEVKADVELDSVLEISPLGVRWQHVNGARPGTMNGSGYVPTTVGGTEWYAEWTDANVRGAGYSAYAKGSFGFFGGPVTLAVVSSRAGAAGLTVVQQPTALNGFTTRVRFNDTAAGTSWHTVRLSGAGGIRWMWDNGESWKYSRWAGGQVAGEESTYTVVTGSFTWAQAKADAEAKGGYLVTVTSQAEWDKVLAAIGSTHASKNLWMGGTDEGTEGKWRWVTGEPWGFTAWGAGEPNNMSKLEHSLHYFGESASRMWNDNRGESVLPGYILEAPKASTAATYAYKPAGADGLGGVAVDGAGLVQGYVLERGVDAAVRGSTVKKSTYSLIETAMTWPQAKLDAESKGGHLAVITSEAEWLEIKSQLASKMAAYNRVWIGASDASQEGVWKWVTGEPFEYSRFQPGQPEDGTSSNYLDMIEASNDFRWNDELNSSKQVYLLEVETPIDAAPVIGPVVVSPYAAGADVALDPAVTGVGPLSYQWVKDGVEIPSGTAKRLALGGMTLAKQGNYVLRVTDARGRVTSSDAIKVEVTGGNFELWRGLMAYYPLDGTGVDATPFRNDGVAVGTVAAADRFGGLRCGSRVLIRPVGWLDVTRELFTE